MKFINFNGQVVLYIYSIVFHRRYRGVNNCIRFFFFLKLKILSVLKDSRDKPFITKLNANLLFKYRGVFVFLLFNTSFSFVNLFNFS